MGIPRLGEVVGRVWGWLKNKAGTSKGSARAPKKLSKCER